ncbi:uncharacterized protein [Palaemon carinicauda]|uniref:uncharacterized protein isoform X2 n=1 Tax=Palaemon carinicauda TaxID=392227 RepID=UPI0035B62B56
MLSKMPRISQTRIIDEDYFVVFSKKPENIEKVKELLIQLECLVDHKKVYFWPEDLVCRNAIGYKHLRSCHAAIIQAVISKPGKIKSILQPNEKTRKKWIEKPFFFSEDLIQQAKNKHNGITYMRGSDSSASGLILRIDRNIDPKGKIRKTIERLSRSIEKDEHDQSQDHIGLEEISGDDSQVVEEDLGELPDDYKTSETIEKPPIPAYYPPQICLANDIVDRIEAIYDHYHGKTLSHFDRFDFRIYTVNINMLEDQTWMRLSRKESGCFPASYYKGSDKKAREAARNKVFKYNSKTLSDHNKFEEEVFNNPKTLFLIIADEAHWGATTADKPHSLLINEWSRKDEHGKSVYSNVILLLVTATPYNLLTENSRLRTDIFYKNENDGFMIKTGTEKIKMRKDGFKMLHRVMWTDSFRIKTEEGVVVILKIPLSQNNGVVQLCVETPSIKKNSYKEDFLPWKGQHFPNGNNNEFMIKGSEKYITLSTIDGEWVLSVRYGTVGFLKRDKIQSEDISNFGLLSTYGEGIILLTVSINNTDKLLTYNEVKGSIELADMGLVGDEYEVPPLNSSFLLEECRPVSSLGSVREYISLTDYINSMRNEKICDQLIRCDTKFEEMARNITNKRNGATFDNLLASEYSYLIIVTNALRYFPFSFENVSGYFENLFLYSKGYQEKRKEYIQKFKDELSKSRFDEEIRPVDVKRFEDILAFYAEKVHQEFKDSLTKFQVRIYFEKPAENLVRSLISCQLHLDDIRLNKIQEAFNEITPEKKSYLHKYAITKELLCDHVVNEILQESETGKIIGNLILKDLKILNGGMNIIRTSTQETGNQLYKTLCIARKISSVVDYSFEILRDFSNVKLRDDLTDKNQKMHNETTPRYRLWERLQPKKCTYTDEETVTTCQCTYKSGEIIQLSNLMVCTKCKHVHKEIEKYEDLDGLPCILILIQKGRLGDTFPPSFSVLDSRLCHIKRTRIFNLACFVQELGRLCRYQNKAIRKLPYALTSESIAAMLTESLHDGATYFSVTVSPDIRLQLDSKILVKRKKDLLLEKLTQNKNLPCPSRKHYDHNNKDIDVNRILLSSEPQIGKTGVYLKVITLLRRKICLEEKYNDEEMDDEEEIDDDDMSDGIDDAQEINEKSKWMYPYWEDIDRAPGIAETVQDSKYTRLYGTYGKGQVPEIIPRSIFKKRTQKKNARKNNFQSITSEPETNQFQLYNYEQHISCTKCSFMFESDVHEISFPSNIQDRAEEANFRISVPRNFQYSSLLQRIRPYTKHSTINLDSLVSNIATTSKAETLKYWIFIPSYNRHNKANVNIYHTMVQEEKGNYKPCLYTAVIAVRSSDFEAYCKVWQSTHAILQIPNKLQGAERDVMSGGIGFARRCIQVFAEFLKLDWIFMLDDNIRHVYEIKETNTEVKRNNGQLTEKTVPLFKVLKHLESQVDGSVNETPIKEFEKFSAYYENEVDHPLEEYTGPSKKYGVIGIKKHSSTIHRVKVPFKKTHVYSFVLLNIYMLKKRNIQYNTWEVFEDISLNNQCQDKGLWVIKYNRFTIWKQSLKTWIPDMFVWNEETSLQEDKYVACNSSDILIKYLKTEFTVNRVIKYPAMIQKDDDDEFVNFLNHFQNPNGRHTMIALLHCSHKLFVEASKNLRDFFNTKSNFHYGDNYFVIVIKSQLCFHESLTRRSRIKEWLTKIISQESEKIFEFEVATSHNLEFFTVKFVTVFIKVRSECKANAAGSTITTLGTTAAASTALSKEFVQQHPVPQKQLVHKSVQRSNSPLEAKTQLKEFKRKVGANEQQQCGTSSSRSTACRRLQDPVIPTSRVNKLQEEECIYVAPDESVMDIECIYVAPDESVMDIDKDDSTATVSTINKQLREAEKTMLFGNTLIARDSVIACCLTINDETVNCFENVLKNLNHLEASSNLRLFGDIRVISSNDYVPNGTILLPQFNSNDKSTLTSSATVRLCANLLCKLGYDFDGTFRIGLLFKNNTNSLTREIQTYDISKEMICKIEDVDTFTPIGTTFIIKDGNFKMSLSFDSEGKRGPRLLTKGEWNDHSWAIPEDNVIQLSSSEEDDDDDKNISSNSSKNLKNWRASPNTSVRAREMMVNKRKQAQIKHKTDYEQHKKKRV